MTLIKKNLVPKDLIPSGNRHTFGTHTHTHVGKTFIRITSGSKTRQAPPPKKAFK